MKLLAFSLIAGFLASVFTNAAGVSAAMPRLDATPVAGVVGAEVLPRDAGERREDLSAFSVNAWVASAVGRIDSGVLGLALGAARCATASGAVTNPATLTIIDYSKPSVEPRMWVLDLETRELVYEELVSHGQGSGGNLATKFSNVPESHQTSIGLFVTDQTYVGRNGYSLRLDGLDEGFNDRARERAIVMHGAPYVNGSITKSLGRLGRSHGCPAVRESVARELINRVKGGSLVFAYYPDAEWLRTSKFLGNCGNLLQQVSKAS
ncbi:MAG TPA: murein L,D-transpeptidase catalytic domain family protein [Vicinamibacterales bacterium]|nr:murein L,D-transpeptidase catalytic domain family protein [Vicinamibacterales bacterium]